MKRIFPFLAAAAIGMSIGSMVAYDSTYKVERIGNEAYLCNKETDQCEIITEDFQLGSLEYRLDGIKRSAVKDER